MKTHTILLPAAVLPLLLCLLPACRSTKVPPPPPPAMPPEGAETDALAARPPVPSSAALHILRWNPAVSSFTEDTFLEGLDRLDRDGTALTSWSLYDWNAVRPGDWAVFARVGGEDPATDGIAGICRMASPSYEAPSWRGDGTTDHYAEIDLRLLNAPAATGLLAAPELDALFPLIDWHGGHSGVPIPPDTAARLALVVADRLAAADSAAFPDGSFAAADLENLPGGLVAQLCPGLRTTSSSDASLRLAADWPTPFDRNDTYPSTFHTPAGDVTIPFMNRDTTAVRKTLSLPGWSALVLPLAGDTFELLILIPPRNATPDELEAGIPEALAAERTADGHTRSVFLSLPRLAARATGPVLRNTSLELDEGSPDALPSTTPLPTPPASTKPLRVLLNRPFALGLRDTQTATLLLLSLVTAP